jgi:hypothetical protein
MSELVAFIKRVWHCSTLFFPHCSIGSLAQELYKALLEQRRHLETDLDWLSKKPGEIVYYLWREADREFRHVIPHQQLLQGDLTGSYQPPSTAGIIDKCLSPSLTIAQSFLPTDLRQRTPPPPPTTPVTTHQGNPAAGNRHNTGGRGGGAAGNGGATGGRGTTRNNATTQRQVNPQIHPLFRAFWSGVPPARQNDPLGRWLSTANTNTIRALELLGLANDDCGRFHLKGDCNIGNCRLKHVPKQLDPRTVEQVVSLLQTGMQQQR